MIGSPFFSSLLFFCFLSVAVADDGATALKLAQAITPTPSGWSSKSSSGFCKWSGLRCDSSGRLTSITLEGKSLSGTLPPELSSLSELTALSMQKNSLSGDIPSFAELSSLKEIYLDNNNFTGVTPGAFAGLTSLQVLRLSDNPNLSPWPFPSEIKDSGSLTQLYLDKSNIMGPLPDIFDTLTSLQNVRLSYNNLTGSLPPSLAKIPIQNLWINNQQTGMSGPIGLLSDLTQLTQVWLHKNQFVGPIPDLSKSTSLFDLQLRDNLLTGIVPPSLASLSTLKNVTLDNNKLQGPTPAFPTSIAKTSFHDNNFCTDTPGEACDPQVNILLGVAGDMGYPILLSDSWKGNNPCNGWAFVSCDSTRKIVTLNLAKHGFTGKISPAIANLTSLKNLYLNDNLLTGSIPNALTSIPTLMLIDVSKNNLTGPIPTFAPAVKFTYKPGNSRLGSNSGSGDEDGTKLSPLAIVAIVVGVLILIAIIYFVFHQFIQKKKYGKFGSDKLSAGNETVKKGYGGSPYGVKSRKKIGNNDNDHVVDGGSATISIDILRDVTDNFSIKKILGSGGFGVVYSGELQDGTKIAVKRMEFSAMGTKGMNEFKAEISVLSKVRHRNLVALLGYCMNDSERLLVYEYMPQGTLAEHLFEWKHLGYPLLTWKQRVTIALDVARGIEYLHNLAQESFIHRDLKPSNILLGDDMRAKVSDFGLVKNAPDGQYSLETKLAGTFGYLAPEYAATGRVTRKVDIFAFGVVLMEILTGRKALDDSLPDEQSHLVAWFRRVLLNKDSIPEALDKSLNPDKETLASMYAVAELAGHCTAREPQQRPDMGHAVNVLSPLVEEWKPSSPEVEEEDTIGIDLNTSLPEALQRWQASVGNSSTFDCDLSYNESESSDTCLHPSAAKDRL